MTTVDNEDWIVHDFRAMLLYYIYILIYTICIYTLEQMAKKSTKKGFASASKKTRAEVAKKGGQA